MNLRTILIFLLAGVFSGCVYYNTVYNTKKLFNEAKKEREKRPGDEPTSTEITKYNQAIEKASKILELHPNSKYVDDAVLILGECFYYKKDFIKAKRKFEELTTYFQESEYFDVGRLWLARTNIKLEDYINAKFQLTELLDDFEVKREIREESRFLLAEIQYEQDYIIEAEQEYTQVAEEAKNKKIRANAYYKLGLCQLRLDYYEDAVESFKSALDNSPNSQFAFDAELNYARALKFAQEFGAAQKVGRSLLDNETYKKRLGLVKLELADCLYQEGVALNQKLRGADLNYLGKIEEALDEYKKITLEYKKTEVAAEASYNIARIYEEDYGDYAAAKEYYEKVKLEYPRSELVAGSEQKSKDLTDLVRLVGMVNKSQDIQVSSNGSSRLQLSEIELLLLEHGVHPELRFRKKRQKLAQATDGGSGEPGQTDDARAKAEDVDGLITNKLQLAETYMFQFGQIDSAFAQYDEIIELFPDHPSTAKAIYSKAFIYENEYQDKEKTDSMLYLLVHRFPDSFQAEEARRILGLPMRNNQVDYAHELYIQAEKNLFSNSKIEEALRQFRQVVDTYPESEDAPKALYALGWIYEKKKSANEKALEIYQTLLKDYPDSQYAKQVQKKIKAVEQPTAEDKTSSEEEVSAQDVVTDSSLSEIKFAAKAKKTSLKKSSKTNQ